MFRMFACIHSGERPEGMAVFAQDLGDLLFGRERNENGLPGAVEKDVVAARNFHDVGLPQYRPEWAEALWPRQCQRPLPAVTGIGLVDICRIGRTAGINDRLGNVIGQGRYFEYRPLRTGILYCAVGIIKAKTLQEIFQAYLANADPADMEGFEAG
jgi:hypothetical protein